ncbi:hypothetical protein PPSIR1_00295 [Plesiocystis pacifica SIR-1]|uniref:Uncharacterized protein n=1 Tax=Plesiocystis pacifica SIR-1 TaxID=391625 RepID=A6GGA5_9BACT|nr:MYXO-CTERM sorting domain-containing protein [Plesiocystis pacifica]EDM75079.1 hypothetical protein PPSIR1_00295 [Plesiocystis pacifica SIR-1]
MGVAFAATLSLAPATATAAEVMCSNDFGSCTVSNEGFGSIFCLCEGGGDGGTTGGGLLDGLSEAELMEICESWLEGCVESESESESWGGESTTGGFETFGEEGFETTFGGEGETTFGGEGETTAGGGTFGEEGFETFGEEDSGGPLDTDTGGGEGTTGTGGGTADSGEGDDAADEDGSTGAGSTSGSGESGTDGGGSEGRGSTDDGAGTDEAADEAADVGETVGGGTGGGQELDETGCSCSAEDAGSLRNMGLAIVLLVGAFGLRRRNG